MELKTNSFLRIVEQPLQAAVFLSTEYWLYDLCRGYSKYYFGDKAFS